MADVRLTPRALEDLRSIGRYTQVHWGREKRNQYLVALNKRFLWLAQNPLRGRPRDGVGEGYRSYPQGAHLIFYLMRSEGVDIIGIPHQSMDVSDGFASL